MATVVVVLAVARVSWADPAQAARGCGICQRALRIYVVSGNAEVLWRTASQLKHRGDATHAAALFWIYANGRGADPERVEIALRAVQELASAAPLTPQPEATDDGVHDDAEAHDDADAGNDTDETREHLSWGDDGSSEIVPVNPPAAREASTPSRRWYGWQILLTDTASWTVALTGSDAGIVLGGLGLAFGSAIVHQAHGHPGRAWGSFGMRAGSLLLALATKDPSTGLSVLLLGELLDATVLGIETKPQPPRVMPNLSVSQNGTLIFGVGGAF